MSHTPHHRRSVRLNGYDYTQAGAYFVTIVTAERVEWFGGMHNGEMLLNPCGQMVLREWQRLPGRFPGLAIDAYVVMPNHIHGILMLCPPNTEASDDSVGAERDGSLPQPSFVPLRPHQGCGGMEGRGVDEMGLESSNAEVLDDSVGAERDGSLPQSSFVPLRPYQGHASIEGCGSNDENIESPIAGVLDECRPTRAQLHVDYGSLGMIVRTFKSSTTLRYHRMRGADHGSLWQRSYYDHIVRGPVDLERIRAYIFTNPTQWELDRENPGRKAK